MAKKKLPAWATWSPDDKAQSEQQANSNENNFLNVTKNFLINKDSQDPMVESKLVSQYNAFKKDNPINLPRMYGGTAPNIFTDSTTALSKLASKSTTPTTKKGSYFQSVLNGDKQLNLSTLLGSKAPTWQKTVLSPLAGIGTVGNYLNDQLENNDGTTSGNKFTGRLLDTARSAATAGAVQPTKQIDTGNKVGNFVADMLGSAGGFSVPNGGLSMGNSIAPIGEGVEKGVTKLLPTFASPVANKLAGYGVNALKGATEFGTLNGVESGLNGDNAKTVLKNIGSGALQGALFNTGTKALGDIAKLPSFLKETKDNAVQNAFNTKFPSDTILKPKESPILNNPLEVNPTPLNNTGSVDNGIKVYRGYALNDNSLNRNLSKPQSIMDVIGKPQQDVDLLPLSYYTESSDVAKSYADRDMSIVNSIMGKTGKSQTEATEIFKTLYGHEPVEKGIVKEHTINPNKVLDLTTLGENTTYQDIMKKLLESEGSEVPVWQKGNDNINSPKWDNWNRIEEDITQNLPDGSFPTYQLMKSKGVGDTTGRNFINWLKENGYDTVKYAENGTNQYAVLDNSMAKNNSINEQPNILKPQNADSNVLNKGNAITPLNKLGSVSEPNTNAKVAGLDNNLNPLEVKPQNRKFIDNSVQNSIIAPKVMKDSIKSQPYIKINNQDTWNKALKTVEENPQAALKNYFNNKTLKSADDTAIGQALITKAIKENRISDANDLSIDLAEKLTKAGQTVQAASIFKRLTPEGMLQYANSSVNRINQVIEKETGIKNKIKLSDDEANQILQGMKEYKSMPEGDAKNIKMAQVMQIINDKQPSSLVDKIRAARNISLLGNLKTNIRNVVGNEIMGAADNAANVVGTPIDKLISLKTGQRSEALPSVSLQAKGFAKGTKNAMQDSFGGIKLEDLKGKTITEKAKILSDSFANPINRELGGNGKFELGNRIAFNNKPMRIAENLVGTTLKVGDNSFKQAYTDDVLNQLMKANKVDTPTDEMKQIAAKIADERTYQDTNSLSKFATGIKNLPQKLEPGKGRDIAQTFVDTLLPYTRTPANILKRGIEYTPAGVVEGGLKLNKLLKTGAENNGNYDLGLQRQAVDRLSRGIVGTGIMAGGAALAKKGLLTGSAAKDKDMAAFDQQNGKQPYAIKVGNKYYDFSWAQPMSMPLSAGVQMVKGKNGQPLTNLKDAATNALTFYSDQPMLQSLQKLLGSQYDSKNIGQRALEAGLQLPNQFVPTALKQVAQMKDNNVKSNYSPNIFEKTVINPFLSKVPGLTQKLPTKIDTLGNEVKQYQGKNNFFNVALNPGNLTTKQNDKTTQMIEDIYNKTGSAIQVPRVAGNTITYTDSKTKKPTTIDLTGKEVQDFQKFIGDKTAKAYSDIAKNYDMSSDSNEANNQANELQSILTKIYNEGKQKVLENRNLQEFQKAATLKGHHYTPGK